MSNFPGCICQNGSAEKYGMMAAKTRIQETRMRINSLLTRHFLEYDPQKTPPFLHTEIAPYRKAQIYQEVRAAKNSLCREELRAKSEINALDKSERKLSKFAFGTFLAGTGAFCICLELMREAIMGRHIPFVSEVLKNIWASAAMLVVPLAAAFAGSAAFKLKSAARGVLSGMIKNEISYARKLLEDAEAHIGR